jgi:hypothetical protein
MVNSDDRADRPGLQPRVICPSTQESRFSSKRP